MQNFQTLTTALSQFYHKTLLIEKLPQNMKIELITRRFRVNMHH